MKLDPLTAGHHWTPHHHGENCAQRGRNTCKPSATYSPKVTWGSNLQNNPSHTQILQENAASVNSNAGGGTHGHLALVLTPVHYNQVTGHVFVTPTHPRPMLPNPRAFFPTQDLQVQWGNYFAAVYTYKVYHATDKALVKQILTEINEKFYKALRDRLVGYRNRTAAKFLHHLYGNYG
eukprot:15215727-Ditylum_brightwellii.AAC.1